MLLFHFILPDLYGRTAGSAIAIPFRFLRPETPVLSLNGMLSRILRPLVLAVSCPGTVFKLSRKRGLAGRRIRVA